MSTIFTDVDNVFLLDLPTTIGMMVDHYLKSPSLNCHTPKDINNGLCGDFAESVIEKCGGEMNGFYLLDTFRFYDAFVDSDHGFDNFVKTKSGGVWNKDALDKYGYPPDVYSNHIGIHVWIFFNGKHYDAEAPHGVDSPWELPFFKRQLSINENLVRSLIREMIDKRKYAYHLTSEWNLRSILKDGIKTSTPADMVDAHGVYMFKNMATLEDALASWFEERIENWEERTGKAYKEIAIKVDISGLENNITQPVEYEILCNCNISPERIVSFKKLY